MNIQAQAPAIIFALVDEYAGSTFISTPSTSGTKISVCWTNCPRAILDIFLFELLSPLAFGLESFSTT